MKTKLLVVAILFTLMHIACSSEKAKATKYHDALILNVNNVFDAITKTEEVFEQTDTLMVEKQLLKLELELNKALDNINKTAIYNNDSTLKIAALNLLNFYKNTVVEHYQAALLRMKQTQSTSKKDMVLGLAIFSTYNTEDSLSAVFKNEISVFEKKYLK